MAAILFCSATIIGLVTQEITLLTDALAKPKRGDVWGVPFWQGYLHEKPVAIAITGVGKIFTAMTTTLFLQRFKPKIVIMTGDRRHFLKGEP